MDNNSFSSWRGRYDAAENNNAWSATASSASAPGATSNSTATTTSSSRPDDDNKNNSNNSNNNNASTSYSFDGSNTSFSSSGAGFGDSNTNLSGSSFGGASFNSNNDTTRSIGGGGGGGGANQLSKLSGDIRNMQISSSITTSFSPLTTPSATFSTSVLASTPSSAQDQTGRGDEGLSSSSSLGEIHDSQSREMSNLNAGYDVHVIQQDQSSPYHSITRFEELNLHEDILKGLYNKKFDRPSKIQEHALPLLMKNPPQHLIGQAQSGTGKTAAFCLAVLSRLNFDDPDCQAIILSPTRELTQQTVDVMKELARYTAATIAPVVYQSDRCYSRVDGQIVIGTPGTVGRLIKIRYLNVAKVRMLVLDEADSMLDMQNLGQMSVQIKRLIPNTAQLVLFSATYPTRFERYIEQFLGNEPKNEIRLRKVEELAIRTIRQFYIDCDDEEDRFSLLSDLYKVMTISKSIIFVHAREVADKITARLIRAGHYVSLLHGGLNPDERDKCMDDFRNTRTKVLVATNVLARGIDIYDVNMVVNYDLPTTLCGPERKKVADYEVYLHRIGRTGRFGRRGVAINFVHSLEAHEILQDIQNHYMCDILKIVTDWMNLEGKTGDEKKETRLDNIEAFIKKTLKGV
ncbi:RNA helicase required for poly(A+) mRNA export [Mortierella hygrophila]|uniref:RNA helicase n=1 Tax=Mortierella hygrophila TaxID=979708 RepID=A0A9P6F7W3_9FUNG|nr:RNA helicase required for poly(A+) mRNA export [Mortierella hygrophila]